MRKYASTKRRHSHQPKKVGVQQEPTFFLFNQLKSSPSSVVPTRFKHQRNTSFRPLAASTPCDIEQSDSFNSTNADGGSPHSTMRHQQAPLPQLTPPVFCSTPKQTRRIGNNQRFGGSASSFKRKFFIDHLPPVMISSQQRRHFTPNSQTFVRYPNNNEESKQTTIRNIKIWLL